MDRGVCIEGGWSSKRGNWEDGGEDGKEGMKESGKEQNIRMSRAWINFALQITKAPIRIAHRHAFLCNRASIQTVAIRIDLSRHKINTALRSHLSQTTHLGGLEIVSEVIGVARNLKLCSVGSCPAPCQIRAEKARRVEYEMQPLWVGQTGLAGQEVFWRATCEPRERVTDAILTRLTMVKGGEKKGHR